MHICVSEVTIIVSDNGFSPGWHQAMIWTNDEILLIWPIVTNKNFKRNIFIQENAFERDVCKMATICPSLNVLYPPMVQVSQVGSK